MARQAACAALMAAIAAPSGARWVSAAPEAPAEARAFGTSAGARESFRPFWGGQTLRAATEGAGNQSGTEAENAAAKVVVVCKHDHSKVVASRGGAQPLSLFHHAPSSQKAATGTDVRDVLGRRGGLFFICRMPIRKG